MTKADLGLPSGDQIATYQQNRENELAQLRDELKDLKNQIEQLTKENSELRGD